MIVTFSPDPPELPPESLEPLELLELLELDELLDEELLLDELELELLFLLPPPHAASSDAIMMIAVISASVLFIFSFLPPFSMHISLNVHLM